MTDVTYPAALTWMTQATDGRQACFEACTDLQQELARFGEQRMAGNRPIGGGLMASCDFAGPLEVQRAWALQAATDYTQ